MAKNKRYHYYQFQLNPAIALIIRSHSSKNDVSWTEHVRVILVHQKKEYLLAKRAILTMLLDNFYDALNRLLTGKAVLDRTFSKTIGLLLDKQLQNACNYVPPLILENYMLYWHDSRASWLYQEDDHYFFEITPSYKWHTSNKKRGRISHSLFLKEYQSIIKIELSQNYCQNALKSVYELRTFLENKLHQKT